MLANDLKLVTKDIAAEVFSVSVKTIDNYIRDGLLPPPTRFVSKEYWHPDDFRAFLARTFRVAASVNDGVTEVTQELASCRRSWMCRFSMPAISHALFQAPTR